MPRTIAVTAMPDLTKRLSPDLIGAAIRAKRTQSHLRLEDAAALCGVAKQTLMAAEHGHPHTQIDTLLRICAGLGIELRILAWPQSDEVDHEWR